MEALMPTTEPAPEIIMDARGVYWRRYPEGLSPEIGLTEPMLSMVPVSDDNEPVPEPYVVYRPIADLLAALTAKDEGEHCDRCTRAYTDVWWCEDDALWRRVYQWATGTDRGEAGLLCPSCFDAGRQVTAKDEGIAQIKAEFRALADDLETADGSAERAVDSGDISADAYSAARVSKGVTADAIRQLLARIETP